MTIFRSTHAPIDIPHLDILSFLFSQTVFDNDTPVWLDAAAPENYLTRASALSFTQRMGWALRNQYSVGAAGGGQDVVMSFVENQVMIAPTFYGILCAGGINATCPPTMTAFEVAKQIQGCEPKAIICSPETFPTARQAVQMSKNTTVRLLIMKSLLPLDLWTEPGNSILTEAKLEWERITDLAELEKRTACLIYSSGTTGTYAYDLSQQSLCTSTDLAIL